MNSEKPSPDHPPAAAASATASLSQSARRISRGDAEHLAQRRREFLWEAWKISRGERKRAETNQPCYLCVLRERSFVEILCVSARDFQRSLRESGEELAGGCRCKSLTERAADLARRR